MIKILIFRKEAPTRKFTIEFEVGVEAIKAWKHHTETDEQFIKRLVDEGLRLQAERMSE